jgi:hypothetical protein
MPPVYIAECLSVLRRLQRAFGMALGAATAADVRLILWSKNCRH